MINNKSKIENDILANNTNALMLLVVRQKGIQPIKHAQKIHRCAF